MESIRIAEDLEKHFPDSILEIQTHRGQFSAVVAQEAIVEMCQFLKEKHKMNHLNCLTGVDNLTRKGKHFERFEVIYQLYSIEHRVGLRLKAQLNDTDNPSIDSITSLWSGADWLEREAFDLLGISFNNHPNLRRVLTPDDWEGHPLRKTYKLKGDIEWSGFTALKEKFKQLSQFDFQNNSAHEGTQAND
jgi:NADH-quinone oxidoreductase subunit C